MNIQKLSFKFLVVLCLGLFLSSCSEDDGVFGDSSPRIVNDRFLSSFYESDELAYSFEYGGDQKLTKQIIRFPEGNLVSDFEYNDQGKIEQMVGRRNGAILTLNFFYNDDLQLDSMYSEADGAPWVINKFLYEGETLTRMIEFAPGSRTLVYNDYTWSNGDIVKRETYFPQEDPSLEDRWVIEYEYDVEKNPYHFVYRDVGFHLIDREPISIHNWTRLKIYNQNSGRILREIDKEYQYLGTGFPFRKRTFIYDGGDHSDTPDAIVSDFFY